MTKTEYLGKLSKYLKKLPREDYQEAMDYFEEYFAEAGPDKEAEIMAELGSPRQAAQDIIDNILDKHLLDESKQSSNKKLILILISAILISPFAIPIFLLLIGVVVTMTVFGFAVMMTLVFGFGVSLWEAYMLAQTSLAAASMSVGLALVCLAIFLFGVWFILILGKMLLWVVLVMMKWIRKRGKKA
ncbi:DUF1700 domain-containing protein [Streptococcus sp. sy010]|uniref:DUF1700 domain-containing protein n=1 Tax=Streptococcus sp. sy010 TaxID=2600148 RepID=UPI0011B72EA4|nr:DUF1700 domain-containing protein [Streptococcus sp. sy010]TWT14407.1 DUF1700 domain-containing protein [Streptococcus sp. sy010]